MWPALGDFHPTASRDACDHLLAGLRGEDVCLAPTDNQCRAADFFEKPPHLLWGVRSKVGIKDGAVQEPYDRVIGSFLQHPLEARLDIFFGSLRVALSQKSLGVLPGVELSRGLS